MDYSPLLILLFGGLIGWLFRHWRAADEISALRGQELLRRASNGNSAAPSTASSFFNRSKNNIDVSGESPIAMDQEFKALKALKALDELDELYQVSAQVKPLEYELLKTREELERLKAIRGSTAASSYKQSNVSLNPSTNGLVNTAQLVLPQATLPQATLPNASLPNGASSAWLGFDEEFAVNLTTDESRPDEVGELYQWIGKVKPLQYELSRLRKSNNSLAADKERVERRLRSQLEEHNQLQEKHKLELSRGLATQLVQKDANIAVIQGQLDNSNRVQNDLRTKMQTELASLRLLKDTKQQLEQDNLMLNAKLTSLESESVERYNHANADFENKLERKNNELSTLRAQLDDQLLQLRDANSKLEEIGQQQSTEAEVSLQLKEAAASKDEKIDQLGNQLGKLQTDLAIITREKDAAIQRATIATAQSSKAETRTAELHVQQKQAEQQWHYEMSSLQSAAAELKESKDQLAELEKTILQSNKERSLLESRLTASDVRILELEPALKQSESSVEALSDYSKIAEDKVIKLSTASSEREAEIEKLNANVKTLEVRLQDRDQRLLTMSASEQAWEAKFNDIEAKLESQLTHGSQRELELVNSLEQSAQKNQMLTASAAEAEANASELTAQLEQHRGSSLAQKAQTKVLEEKLVVAQAAMQESAASLTELTLQRQSETQLAANSQAESQAASTAAESALIKNQAEIGKLKAHIQSLVNENGEYARFQQKTSASAEAAEASAAELKVQLERQREHAVMMETQTKALEEKLIQAQASSKQSLESIDRLTKKQQSDALQISELQAAPNTAEINAVRSQTDSLELARLNKQIQALENNASQLARYKQEASEKSAAVEINTSQLKSALEQQRSHVTVLEKQNRTLENTLAQTRAESQDSLTALKRQRQSDAQRISELQTAAASTKADVVAEEADVDQVNLLKKQVQTLKNETNKYARFQQDAQATARELLEAKESLKLLDQHSQAADAAAARLMDSNLEVARLQKEVNKAKQYKLDLREQRALVLDLQAKQKQSAEMQIALDTHQSRTSNLEQMLKSRDAELKVIKSQVDKSTKRDSGRMDKATVALADSKKRISELSKALSKAETLAKKAEKNDLELRRLRSELRAMQSERDKTAKALDQLEAKAKRQSTPASKARVSDASVAALKKLENDIVRRDQQIEQLKGRLAAIQQPRQASKTIERISANKGASASKTTPPTVLFSVPKEKDDLKRIKGIGPVMEKMLNKLGITSFKQIAGFSTSDIARVSEAIETFPGRIERDDWVAGAKKHYKLKYQSAAKA